ncbi:MULTISPECIES: hypothetical protein [Nocardia]|nr:MULTISPECIES: hypothetical protein [Nocardia]
MMTSGLESFSDAQLAAFDIPGMLAAGLSGDNDVARRDLFGIGAVGAAVSLDHVGTLPKSVAYLADFVQAGGTHRALELAEPLPAPEQTALIKQWLVAAAGVGRSVETDDLVARWLRAVATVLAVRVSDLHEGEIR